MVDQTEKRNNLNIDIKVPAYFHGVIRRDHAFAQGEKLYRLPDALLTAFSPEIYLKKKWEFCGRELSCHTYHVGFSEESYISAGENDDRTYKIDHLKKVEA